MSPEKTSEAKKPEPRDVYKVPLWLKIIGPVMGAFAGLATALVRIGDEFYDKMKNQFGVRELNSIRHRTNDILNEILINKQSHQNYTDKLNSSIKDILKDVEVVTGTPFANAVDEMKRVSTQAIQSVQNNTKEFASAKLMNEEAYVKQWKGLLEKQNIDTKGIKRIFQGTAQRWHNVGHDTRLGIAVSAVISAGAVIAGLFMLNLNTRLRHELRDIHQKLGDKAAAVAGDSPERISAKENPIASENLPRSQVDVQDAQHDRMASVHAEQARA
jgi:hypothetical protein